MKAGLNKVTATGADCFEACCPAHDDTDPSFSVRFENEKTLFHCHAGCTKEAVLESLRDKKMWRTNATYQPRLKTIARNALIKRPSETELSDTGNAERFAKDHRGYAIYDETRGRWLTHDGSRWSDAPHLIEQKSKQTVRSIAVEAGMCGDEARMKAMAKFCIASASIQRRIAMLRAAQSETGMHTTTDKFDTNPDLLNVANGTINLKTGELLDANPENMITKAAPTHFDRKASCPVFRKFFAEMFENDQELMHFVQKALGYSLTGHTSERTMFVLYGSNGPDKNGSNGKTTLVEITAHILGDGFTTCLPPDSLYEKPFDGVPADIAKLRGARFVTSSESESGKKFRESRIKELTGGDRITARFMRENFFDFKPEAKLWFLSNYIPEIRGTDQAIWDRLALIPCRFRVPPERKDKHLGKKLEAEASGILNWLLEGCKAWYAEGLNKPEAVTHIVNEFRSEMDAVGRFVDQCCDKQPALAIKVGDFRDAFQQWCDVEGSTPPSHQRISQRLRELGFETGTRTARGYKYQGLALKTSSDCKTMKE